MTKRTAKSNAPITAALPEEAAAQKPETQGEDTAAETGEAAPEPETAAEPEKPKEAVVYIGPTIERLVNHGTIYEGGVIPEYLEEKIREIPAIRGLIVPVSELAYAAREITREDGRYKMLYDMVLGAVKLR